MLPSGEAKQSASSPGQKRDTAVPHSAEPSVCSIMLPEEVGLTQQETCPSPRRLRRWQRWLDADGGAFPSSC